MRVNTLPPHNLVELRPAPPDHDRRVRLLVEGATLLYLLSDAELIQAVRALRASARGVATP